MLLVQQIFGRIVEIINTSTDGLGYPIIHTRPDLNIQSLKPKGGKCYQYTEENQAVLLLDVNTFWHSLCVIALVECIDYLCLSVSENFPLSESWLY